MHQHAALVGELGELVADHPLREGLRAHLALALYRSGRQADALRAIDDARATSASSSVSTRVGPLRDLEAAILEQDPSLDLDAPPGAPPAESEVAAPVPDTDEPATEVRPSGGPLVVGTGWSAAPTSSVPSARSLDTPSDHQLDGDRRRRARNRQDQAARGAPDARPRHETPRDLGPQLRGWCRAAFWPWLSAWRSLLERVADVAESVPPQLALLARGRLVDGGRRPAQRRRPVRAVRRGRGPARSARHATTDRGDPRRSAVGRRGVVRAALVPRADASPIAGDDRGSAP